MLSSLVYIKFHMLFDRLLELLTCEGEFRHWELITRAGFQFRTSLLSDGISPSPNCGLPFLPPLPPFRLLPSFLPHFSHSLALCQFLEQNHSRCHAEHTHTASFLLQPSPQLFGQFCRESSFQKQLCYRSASSGHFDSVPLSVWVHNKSAAAAGNARELRLPSTSLSDAE